MSDVMGNEYTKEEYFKMKQDEKENIVKRVWFKHKEKELYKYQLDLYKGDLNNYIRLEG